MISQILLDVQVLCPANYAHLAIFKLWNEKRYCKAVKIAFFLVLNGLSCGTIKQHPKFRFIGTLNNGHIELAALDCSKGQK